MAKKTKAELSAGLSSSFPNNTAGEITPAILRAQQQDIIDSMLARGEAGQQDVDGKVNFSAGALANGKELGIVYDGMVSMVGNATNTVIATAGTAVKVAGTFVVQSEENFTCDTTGKCVYDGAETIRIPVDAMVDMAPVAGSNIKLALYIAVNGTIIPHSIARVIASSGGSHCINTFWQVDFNPSSGDYCELYVANIDNDTDILVTDAKLRIN